MDMYPWWSEEHKAFQKEIKSFVEEVMPIDAETRWTRQFPSEIFRRVSEKGYTGAAVPQEYGGLGLGATGACIAAEGFARMPGPGRVFSGNMIVLCPQRFFTFGYFGHNPFGCSRPNKRLRILVMSMDILFNRFD